MNNKKLVIFGISLGLIVGFIAIYLVYNKPHTDFEKKEAAFSFSANELFDIFNEDKPQAQELPGLIIEVTGTVQDVGSAYDGSLGYILAAENAMMGGVNAVMSPTYEKEEINFNEGDRLRLKCRCLGFDDTVISEVKLDNCFVEEIY
jgi:hypothetical protein